MQEPVGDGNREGKTEGILKTTFMDSHNEQPVKLDNNKDKNKDKDKDMRKHSNCYRQSKQS